MNHRSPQTRLILITLALLIPALFLAGCNGSTPNTTAETQDLPTESATRTAQFPTATQTVTITATATIPSPATLVPVYFDGDKAYQTVADQLAFGPRWPGSSGHQEVGDYLIQELEDLGWGLEEQTFAYKDIIGRNIIASSNKGKGPVIILGAHYDTRKIADRTPGSTKAVPGAVDGASGVAVLLELARTLDLDQIGNEIWLTFFDVEDNGSGGIPGYDWIVGSTYMANNLTIAPEAMVLVDMVGDADQQLYLEGNSDPTLQQQLWEIARELGYGNQFINQYRHTMIDDHLPFAQMGIPAVDIIDFDYPYWHTIEDTAEKVHPESLARVGRTLETWLENK